MRASHLIFPPSFQSSALQRYVRVLLAHDPSSRGSKLNELAIIVQTSMSNMGSATGTLSCYVAIWLLAALNLVSAREYCPPSRGKIDHAERILTECNGHTTFTNTADLTSLSICSTYTGNITIHSFTMSAVSATPTPSVWLKDLVQISNGSLEFSDITAVEKDGATPADFAITGPNLLSVTNQLSFNNMTTVVMPTFSRLLSADTISFSNVTFREISKFDSEQFQTLQWVRSISFTDTGVTKIGPFGQEFNLAQMGFSLGLPYGATLHPASVITLRNAQLQSITLTGYDVNIQTDLSVEGNSDDLTVESDMRNGSVHMSGARAFNASNLQVLVPSSLVNPGDPQMIASGTFSTLNLPSLTQIQDTTLQIRDNKHLSNLSLPSLGNITSLDISDNSQLHNINLPNLTYVGSLLNIEGPVNKCVLLSYWHYTRGCYYCKDMALTHM